MDNILEIRDLHIDFETNDGIVNAVRGINADVRPGECLGVGDRIFKLVSRFG